LQSLETWFGSKRNASLTRDGVLAAIRGAEPVEQES
jgi:hypothetical protein